MQETRCARHSFEVAENSCRNCGYDFCNECLVYAFGAGKPPYCVSCALAAAGVRSNAANRPAYSKRELRRRQKEQRKLEREQHAAAKVEVSAAPIDWSVPEGSSDDFEWADEPRSDAQNDDDHVVSF